MKFKLNENVSAPLIFRGVEDTPHYTKYFGGKFYADNPMDASNYGDIIEVYSITQKAKLFKYASSIDFCEDSGFMENYFEVVSTLSNGEFSILGDAIDAYIYNGENPNLGLSIVQGVAKLMLEKLGYDGAEWSNEDDMIPHQFQIWNYDVLTHIETISEVNANNKYM